MQSTFEDVRVARAAEVREIIQTLRAGREENGFAILSGLIPPAHQNAVLHALLSPSSTRSHLIRIAFPYPRADLEAIEAGLTAGNTLKSLWCLASRGSFEFEGRRRMARALRSPDGQLLRAKNGTIRILYDARRLTDADRRALRASQVV